MLNTIVIIVLVAMLANNLTELCNSLRADPDLTTEQQFNMLKSLLGKDINMRYEIANDDDQDAVKLTTDTQSGRFSHLNNLNISRVLLTTIRSQTTDYSRELVRQCNGVILEFPTWKVLAVPSQAFNPNFRVADVKKNFSQYSVYEIKDGSTVTLYWYGNNLTDGAWRMSSANGFDVGGYQWLGKSTYMMALQSLTGMYPDFSFDRLDKTKSYTIGFRHADFHPLATDPSKIWLIQACDLMSLKPVDVNIGIPLQTTVVTTYDAMIEKNISAMTKYMTSEQHIHYGYVLRGNCGASSDIVLESELLKRIRQMVYNLPKKRIPNAAPITPDTRIEYIVLRAYLSSQRIVFTNLFPQFKNLYKKYDDIFAKLVCKITATLQKKRTRDPETPADQLAISFAEHIRKTEPNATIKLADEVLYRAKENGRNQCLAAPSS